MGWKAMVFVGLLVMGSFVYIHEATHVAVAHQYGCEAEIEQLFPTEMPDSPMDAFAYVSTSDCPDDNEAMHEIAQNQVEAVGYQLMPLYMFVALLGMVIVSG